MTERKSALIIGAGIGGIATAIYLAKNGYNVSVLKEFNCRRKMRTVDP